MALNKLDKVKETLHLRNFSGTRIRFITYTWICDAFLNRCCKWKFRFFWSWTYFFRTSETLDNLVYRNLKAMRIVSCVSTRQNKT